MLHLLKEYSIKEGLNSEEGFKPQTIKWILDFSKDGKFLAILPMFNEDDTKKGKLFKKCPFVQMTSNAKDKSQFLWGTADLICFLGVQFDDPKIIPKRKYFFEQLVNSGREFYPELVKLAEQLNRKETIKEIHQRFEEYSSTKPKPSDKISFMIDDEFLLENNELQKWWREFRISNLKEEKPKINKNVLQMRSFMSGEDIIPVETHPTVKGLFDIGEMTQGDPLISFKPPSFCSYGLKQSLNAAVSEEEAYIYSDALSALIEKQSINLAGPKIVYWFKNKIQKDDDPLNFLNAIFDDEQQELSALNKAKELLESIKNGEKVDLYDNYYFALTLSGGMKRVMVRDWMEGKFVDLVENINHWFSSLEIIKLNGDVFDRTPTIESIITCLLPERSQNQKYKDWVKPIGADRISIWKVALNRKLNISLTSLTKVVIQHNKFQQRGDYEKALEDKRKYPKVISLLHTRMSLMKLYHIRKGDKNMSASLNPNHPEPAYHCGRLMAVLARLQYAALEDVGAGVIQRYYTSASSTPALVFGRLTNMSQHHLSKLDSKGLANWFEIKIAEIWGGIKDNVPKTLTLEQQSLFALGYYHQMADMRSKKDNNENNNEE